MPRGTVVPTVFSSWRRTLLVRFTRNRSAKRDRTAQKRTPAPLDYKGTEKHSLPRRQCHVALSSRQCSLLATYLARSIYAQRWCDERPPAQNRPPAPLNYKETEKDSLPRRQCHVALSFRQCFLPASDLARSIYEERRCDERPPAQKRTPAPLNYKETEKDPLPRRQCHVALSFRQCSLLASDLVRCDLRGTTVR